MDKISKLEIENCNKVNNDLYNLNINNNNDNKINRDLNIIKIPTSKKELLKKAQNYCEKVIDALNYSSTPYHFVEWAKKLLIKNDFEQIYESNYWCLYPGKKYFLTRNLSSIIVFSIGIKVDLKTTSFAIIGGHTDSPSLRFAPNSFKIDNTYEKINTQLYGGGQWQSWFDRDLSIAGKIVIKNPKTNILETRLYKEIDPIIFIPNLCIHLRTNKDNFYWNNEDNLKAIFATNFFDDNNNNDSNNTKDEELTYIEKKIGKKLSGLISSTLNVSKDKILDYNLILYDTNGAKFTGIQKEFISSERFDNQGTSITSILSIIEASQDINNSDTIYISSLFDSEEIGSLTYQGANSSFFKDYLIRLFSSIHDGSLLSSSKDFNNYFQACCARSFLLSTDMAHLYHPNYSEYYQSQHKPLPNLGPVIKTNSQGKYSTEAEGASLVKFIANNANIPIQDFIVRQDIPSGTTIGPIIAGQCGIRSVDIGCPQLAMHSIREQTAVVDMYYLGVLFIEYFKNYSISVGNLFE